MTIQNRLVRLILTHRPGYFLGSVICFCILACKNNTLPYVEIYGETMGTYYAINCQCPKVDELRGKIDSCLLAINKEVSTYMEDSYISSFNRSATGIIRDKDKVHFERNLNGAIDIFKKSAGFFDPSVMPLVNHWGFGYVSRKASSLKDSLVVDSLLQLVGLEKIIRILDTDSIRKSSPQQQLDFSAIAKGYAVDQISEMLSGMGSKNHLVDIGGEIVAIGLNPNSKTWVVGINKPDDKASYEDVFVRIQLPDRAIASSGNYRNFYEIEGQKYGHTLNPFTGFPFQDSLLAVSVIAGNCMLADALATSCMAMGFEKARIFINNFKDVDACFLVGASDGSIQKIYSNGFIQYAPQ